MPCRPPITIKLLEPRHLRRYGDMLMEVEPEHCTHGVLADEGGRADQQHHDLQV